MNPASRFFLAFVLMSCLCLPAPGVNVRTLTSVEPIPASCLPPLEGATIQFDGRCEEYAGLGSRVLSVDEFVPILSESCTQKTRAWMARDDAFLYVAFDCSEDQMSQIKTEVEERDGPVWTDDCVEIFIDDDRDGKTYYHFAISASGAIADQKGLQLSWNAEWEALTDRRTDGWSAEARFPLSLFGGPITSGTVWGVNLCREEQPHNELSSWTQLGGRFHRPARFRTLVFKPSLLTPTAEIHVSTEKARITEGNGELNLQLENKTLHPLLGSGSMLIPGQAPLPFTFSLRKKSQRITIPVTGIQGAEASLFFRLKDRNGKLLNASACYIRTEPDRLAHPMGYRLKQLTVPGTGTLSLWWAEGTNKIQRDTPIPARHSARIEIEAARNEYEPFQLVLRPQGELGGLCITCSDLKGPGGARISREAVTFNLVDYIEIKQVSDAFGSLGPAPDALPAMPESLDCAPGRQNPIWGTVFVPKNCPAGHYKAVITIEQNGKTLASVPLRLRVFDFALTDETHTETAFGVAVNLNYHGIDSASTELLQIVHEKYMLMSAAHRIAPYNPMRYAPIKVSMNEKGDLQFDYTDFDRAARYFLDELHLSNFNFETIAPARFIYPKPENPADREIRIQAIRAICAHLRENNWLKKAYDYWVDEPSPNEYESVREGMDLLKEADPELRRLLTFCVDKAPVPYFYDSVNLWTPILSLYDMERAHERQKLGESVWWYVCTGPREPYPNNFIDHPAINHRIRAWMIDKYKLDGDLYWSATYWAQNPWEQAMSIPRDGIGNWGNGDGRLLYPPCRTLPAEPVLDGPITSIRFEILREGMEDREYLWTLDQELDRARAVDSSAARRAVKAGEKAQQVVDRLVTSLTDFETDPAVLYKGRREIAEAIVQLKKIQ